jgi:hypothetical protein
MGNHENAGLKVSAAFRQASKRSTTEVTKTTEINAHKFLSVISVSSVMRRFLGCGQQPRSTPHVKIQALAQITIIMEVRR